MPRAVHGRWIEPEITDFEAFHRANPETVVSSELLADLEPEIGRRARSIDNNWDPEVQRELQAEISLRVIEAATSFRSVDPVTNAPVFDYLLQSRGYIVQHAAGRVFAASRRARAAEARRVLLTDPVDDEAGGEVASDPADPNTLGHSLSERLEHAELREAIAARLSPAQMRVFRLLDAGYSRRDIGECLGLSRQMVHDHVQAIRRVTTAVLAAEREPATLAVRRHRARRPVRASRQTRLARRTA